jgi:hypothetical protein
MFINHNKFVLVYKKNREKMQNGKISIIFLILIIITATLTFAQPLPRSTPEKEGISSHAIYDFVNAAEKSKTEFHSFMLLRHGKVVAEGWWNPYNKELLQKLYSVSKSFTSTAIGFAVSEGKLKLSDKVISFFPDKLPDSISAYLKQLEIKDLLTMATGHDPEPTRTMENTTDWVKSFLAQSVVYQPGTRFAYNSAASYMLSAIIQKVTGKKVIEYLTPRLFKPLGISGADWETDPDGINKGGWGLRIHTEDMAKFGQFLLQKGKWNRKQLLPESWIKEASSVHIMQAVNDSTDRIGNDWAQGYGYQFWRCTNNCFRADGAYGQIILVMPDKDAVLVITSESRDMQEELNLVWKYLLPSMNNSVLPENTEQYNNLNKRLSALSLQVPSKTSSPVALSYIQKVYKINSNNEGINKVSFKYRNDAIHFTFGKYTFAFGAGKWEYGETLRRDPAVLVSKSMFKGKTKVAGCYQWMDDNTLELKLRYIESPHTETFTIKFTGKNIDVKIRKSTSGNDEAESFHGEAE